MTEPTDLSSTRQPIRPANQPASPSTSQTANPPVNRESLIRVLSEDCQVHAQMAEERLREVIERFREGNPLAAIGAFEGTTEMVLYMDAILKRLAATVRRL